MDPHYKRLLFYIILYSAISYFEDEIKEIAGYEWTGPIVFVILLGAFLVQQFIAFRKGKYFRSKYDMVRRGVSLALGLGGVATSAYFWQPESLMLWVLLFLGTIFLFNGIFYVNAIKFYHNGDQFMIYYKGQFDLSGFNSFSLNNGTLKIEFPDRRIEVYNVSMSVQNVSALQQYLTSNMTEDSTA